MIAIIIAAVMVLSAAAMSVSAVRDVIIGFITEVYETFTGVRVEPSEDAPETLEEYYEVTWVPEGYILMRSQYNIGMGSQLFKNSITGDSIEFNQYAMADFSTNYDTEKVDMEQTTICNHTGLIIDRDDGYEIAWDDGKYVYEICIIISSKENFDKKLCRSNSRIC